MVVLVAAGEDIWVAVFSEDMWGYFGGSFSEDIWVAVLVRIFGWQF